MRLRFLVPVLAILTFAAAARADLKIDITKGNVEPMPIAVTGLTGTDSHDASGAQISQVIAADLERSGLFRTISPQAFIEQVSNGDAIPRYADWRQSTPQALVTGTITPVGTDRVRVSFRLWDALGEQQIAGKGI